MGIVKFLKNTNSELSSISIFLNSYISYIIFILQYKKVNKAA